MIVQHDSFIRFLQKVSYTKHILTYKFYCFQEMEDVQVLHKSV